VSEWIDQGFKDFSALKFCCGIKFLHTSHFTLADFLNKMPSTEPPDDGAAEDIQESAEAALAATSQGI